MRNIFESNARGPPRPPARGRLLSVPICDSINSQRSVRSRLREGRAWGETRNNGTLRYLGVVANGHVVHVPVLGGLYRPGGLGGEDSDPPQGGRRRGYIKPPGYSQKPLCPGRDRQRGVRAAKEGPRLAPHRDHTERGAQPSFFFIPNPPGGESHGSGESGTGRRSPGSAGNR